MAFRPEQIAAGMDRLRRLGRVIIVAAILLGSDGLHHVGLLRAAGAISNAVYYAYDQGLWEIGQYVLGLPADEAVYVTPRPATDMTLAFAWREGRPVRHFDGRHAFVAAAADRPTNYIVIEHEDFRGGQLLRSLYPDATETHTFRDRAGQVYARAYRVPPGAVAARQPKYQAQRQLAGHRPGRVRSGSCRCVPTVRVTSSTCSYGGVRPANPIRNWTVFTHLLGPAKPDGNRVWAGTRCAAGAGQRSHHSLGARRPDPG